MKDVARDTTLPIVHLATAVEVLAQAILITLALVVLLIALTTVIRQVQAVVRAGIITLLGAQGQTQALTHQEPVEAQLARTVKQQAIAVTTAINVRTATTHQATTVVGTIALITVAGTATAGRVAAAGATVALLAVAVATQAAGVAEAHLRRAAATAVVVALAVHQAQAHVDHANFKSNSVS